MKITEIVATATLVLTSLFCIYLGLYSAWWLSEVGLSWKTALLSVGIPIISGTLIVVALVSGRSARLSGALTVLATVVATLGSEAYLTFGPQAKIQIGPPKPGPYIQNQENASSAALEIDGVSVFPLTHPRGYILSDRNGDVKVPFKNLGAPFLPLGGIPNVTTVFCNEGYGTVVYQSDRHGFRNYDSVWDHSDLTTVAAIGDSYTIGACVHDGESYVDRLGRTWPRIINLGMPGNGPLLELAGLKEYLPQIRPRLVLWFFTENNDFTNLSVERQVPLLMEYLSRDSVIQHLPDRRTKISSILKQFVNVGLHANAYRVGSNVPPNNVAIPTSRVSADKKDTCWKELFDLIYLRHIRSAFGWFHVRVDRDLHKLFSKVLREAKRTVESWGGQLVVVMIPGPRLSGTLLETGFPEAYSQFIQQNIRRSGIQVIDPASAMRKSVRPVYPPNGGHYSPHGNAIIADVIAHKLSSMMPK